ncbi:MAG TPA: hypothetical protein VHV29_10620 [Terriglobales bacterium]|jgi:hypothetical protein|nr:hypothetical protein [Terriglobales bacterium]
MTSEPATLQLRRKTNLRPKVVSSVAQVFRVGNGVHFRGFSRRTIFYVVVFLAAFLIIFSRRPDAVTNAQFFAEDGQRWYADAYRCGVQSVLIPDEAGGYLHTAPRLAAILSLLVPFSRAPLVMNLCAILVQVLPVIVFVSPRFSNISLWKRLLASFIYLGLPNSYGTNANATNMQWHLALSACLVLLGTPSNDRKWKVFDVMILFLMSVESPMGILFLPFALTVWWIRRNHWTATLCAVIVPGAILQAVVVLTSHSRQIAPNGASITRLLSILGRQVFLAPLVGTKTVLHFALRYSAQNCVFLEGVATAAGLIVLFYAIRHAPVELKLFIVFSFLVFAMSLARPLAGTPSQPQWEWMRFPGTANRYYFMPIVAFLAALLWTVDSGKSLAIRWFGISLLLFLPFGIRRDWRYPAFTDMHFREYASQFQAAPSGTRVLIPINPPPWRMALIKR